MEDPCSVNSPRRILSFSRNRRAHVPSSPDSDDRSPTGFGVSGEHGPKLSEVYGFVGSITTVVATAIFIVWTYFPDHWLHSMGIYYYPNRFKQAKRINYWRKRLGMVVVSPGCQEKILILMGEKVYLNILSLVLANFNRYWALAVPTYVVVTIVLAIGLYTGLNFLATPPPTSLSSIFDEFSREPLDTILLQDDDDEYPIEPISDIDINQINDIMFSNLNDNPVMDIVI